MGAEAEKPQTTFTVMRPLNTQIDYSTFQIHLPKHSISYEEKG